MWKIILIFVSFLFKINAQVPEDGDCYLEGVEENDWSFSFRNTPVDDFEDKEFRRFRAENIETVEVKGTDYGHYFKAALEGGELIISPTEDFKNYEKEEESVADPEMNIQLAFLCSNNLNKNLRFYQPITDHNTYDPEFEQTSYTYQLPMPLPANFDIAVFGGTIQACDMDISNTRLDFSISPDEDFSLSWGESVPGSKNKCHTAVVRTKTWLRLTNSKSYEIIVTDKGGKEAKAEFKIEIDEQTTLPPNPQFDSAYYTAKYNSEDDPHSITDTVIGLKDGCSNLNQLNLIGDHKDYFDVDCVAEKVVVKLNGNLPDNVLEDEDNRILLFTIEATLEKAEEPGRTALVVYLPKLECQEVTTPTPTTCPPTVTPTECPVCSTEMTSPYTCPPCNTECPSTPTDCPPCSTTPPVDCTTLSSTECPPCSTTPSECPSTPTECPVTCPPCSTTPGECPSTPTECPVTCPPCSTTPGECPSTPTECPVTCPPCSTTPGECPSTPTECPLTCPPCSTTPGSCPSVSTECPVTCPTPELTTECPLCPSTPGEYSSALTKCPLTCPPCSTTPGDCSTECPSHSTTPSDCPPPTECPTASPPAECSTPDFTTCPPCLTTAEPTPPQTVIKFEQDNYWYKIKTWHVGYIIGIVRAVVIPKEDIEYSIVSDTDEDFMECNKITGELKVTKEVEAGTYNFVAYAIGVDTGAKTQAIVVAEIISGEEEEPESKNSILVLHITEEQEINILLPCEYTFCKYEITWQEPKTDEDIFRLDNNNLHVAEIKRESKEIIDMLVPQFALHLFVTEVGDILHKNKRSNNSSRTLPTTNLQTKELPSEWAFIPADVPNLPNQLLLSLIIDDINNNAPVFAIGSELVVGYPTAELAIQLTPPYLVKIVATDLDAEDNAIIKYSTESPHFIVHPQTGVIYPGEDAFDDESNLRFTVTATDRNGASDGLKADLNIEVKPLRKENLMVLMVRNLMLEDIDDTMQQLSEKTNMKINYLTAAVIPLDNNKNSLSYQADNTLRQLKGFLKSMVIPRANSDHSSRIIVYGLDPQKQNEPIETDELQELLEDAEVLEDYTADKWEPGSSGEGDKDEDEEPSTAGFIAAIAVLASLLVIFMIAAAAFYYFKIYRVKKAEPYDTMEEEDTNSVNFEKNPRTSSVSKYEDAPQRRVTGFVFNPPPIEEDEDEFGEKRYEDTTDYGVKSEWNKNDADVFGENETNKVRFVDIPEDDLYSESKIKYEDSPIDFDGDQRKSVTFKETVEKINIIVDDRQDEDILDERL